VNRCYWLTTCLNDTIQWDVTHTHTHTHTHTLGSSLFQSAYAFCWLLINRQHFLKTIKLWTYAPRINVFCLNEIEKYNFIYSLSKPSYLCRNSSLEILRLNFKALGCVLDLSGWRQEGNLGNIGMKLSLNKKREIYSLAQCPLLETKSVKWSWLVSL
jgi:hypothetical protein